MTDTPNSEHIAALIEERDAFRNALVASGFSDDGETLHGTVEWDNEFGETHTARVEVDVTDRFPFAPPNVKIIELEKDFKPTFHIETDGRLCLWSNDVPVDDAPWRDIEKFLVKVSGWFEKTAKGWPEDNDADLERYLEDNEKHILMYDSSLLEANKYYRTRNDGKGTITTGERLKWLPNTSRMKDRGVRRRERNLLLVKDVGLASRPIRTWQDLKQATGEDCEVARRLIEIGSLDFILVRYQRGKQSANVVLEFNRTADGVPALKACESADSSINTRTLRAGPASQPYSEKKVAIVGCGAIGSYVADLLFRSGVRHITLIDSEKLRPGNLVRHVATDKSIGSYKTDAVGAKLAELGLSVDKIATANMRIITPEQALELVGGYDVVVDATADARAAALLIWAAKIMDSAVVSACVQREGAVARVDRFPLWDDERHLDPLPITPGSNRLYEQGCGSPVSNTPPMSVVKAATIACQVVLDELSARQSLPATILEVIRPQPEKPYNVIGIVTSNETNDS